MRVVYLLSAAHARVRAGGRKTLRYLLAKREYETRTVYCRHVVECFRLLNPKLASARYLSSSPTPYACNPKATRAYVLVNAKNCFLNRLILFHFTQATYIIGCARLFWALMLKRWASFSLSHTHPRNALRFSNTTAVLPLSVCFNQLTILPTNKPAISFSLSLVKAP